MKNITKLLGIIALVAIIGFTMAACDEPKDALDKTTWTADDDGDTFTLTFNSPDFEMTVTWQSEPVLKGTYSVSGSTVTFTVDGGSDEGTLTGGTLTFAGLDFKKK